MTQYAYNGYLKLVGSVEDDGDCPDGCELTADAPPEAPYPDGWWPHYLPNGWELVEVVPKLALYR